MKNKILSPRLMNLISNKVMSKMPFSLRVDSEMETLNNFLDNYFKLQNSNKVKKLSEYSKKYPLYPKVQLVKARENFNASNWEFVENLRAYAHLRENWINENHLDVFNCEFLWPGLYFGAFGNHNQIFSLIRARKSNLRKRNIVGFYKPSQQFTNRALMNYLAGYGNIKLIPIDNYPSGSFYRDLMIPSTFVIPFDGVANYQTFAVSELNKIEFNLGKFCELQLTEEHEEYGRNFLSSFGINKNDWFVTLHMREPSYRGENRKNTTENFRNVEMESYTSSINEVIKRGGYVVRVGDSKMTPLPPKKGVIDYAISKNKSSVLDLFFGAKCAFAITTSSGYRAVPSIFGRPQLQTNFLPGTHVYEGGTQDVFILRKLVQKQAHETIPILRQINDPFLDIGKDLEYSNRNLSWISNTPEELLEGTRFMISKYVDISSEYKKIEIIDKEQINNEININHPYKPHLYSNILLTH